MSRNPYAGVVPTLWGDTIEAHRREVHDAILETTADLAVRHGMTALTMTQIAEGTGIGRATLYKYFSSVEAILDAWHERNVARHLERLANARDQHTAPGDRLSAVLEAYALISQERASHQGSHEPHTAGIAAFVHRGEHVAAGQRQLSNLLREVLSEAAKSGDVRDDVPASELASYCLHALDAAATLRSKPALVRLLDLTRSALRPRRMRS